jgi:hypothetical protein
MAAGNWVDWNTGDLVTAASFQDIQDSIVFIYADETAANAALTNKVEGTIFYMEWKQLDRSRGRRY